LLEKDLYEPVRQWLMDRGYNPKAEVMGCDILALKDELALAVELKVTLNLEVILQAVDRQRFADMVYIAVPKKGRLLYTKRWRMITHLLKRLEIGLLLVSEKGKNVEEALEPVPFDRERSRQAYKRKRKSAVAEFNKRHGDYNTGGVNKVKLVTAYRESALLIAHLLSVNGPMSPKRLREMGTDARKTQSILSRNVYGWFERLSKGLYMVSPRGYEALKLYNDVVSELSAGYDIANNSTAQKTT